MPSFEFPTLDNIKACIRDSGQSWVFVSFNNQTLCTDCARANFREVVNAAKGKGPHDSVWKVRKAYSAYDENSSTNCAHCGAFIGIAFEAYGPDYVHNAYTSMDAALNELAYLIDLHYGHECEEQLQAAKLFRALWDERRIGEFTVNGATFGIRRLDT